MTLAECAPDLMQRLSRLPTAPYVGPLRRRKLRPFPLGHRHHLWRDDLYQRCCIDPLRPQRLSGIWIALSWSPWPRRHRSSGIDEAIAKIKVSHSRFSQLLCTEEFFDSP